MRRSILVVDPDGDAAELLAVILGPEGHNIAVAQSMLDARTLLSSSHFDLIITEAFDQDRTFEFNPAFLAQFEAVASSTPVLLCSTYASTGSVRAGDFNLAGVVARPFELSDLLAKVREQIDHGGLWTKEAE